VAWFTVYICIANNLWCVFTEDCCTLYKTLCSCYSSICVPWHLELLYMVEVELLASAWSTSSKQKAMWVVVIYLVNGDRNWHYNKRWHYWFILYLRPCERNWCWQYCWAVFHRFSLQQYVRLVFEDTLISLNFDEIVCSVFFLLAYYLKLHLFYDVMFVLQMFPWHNCGFQRCLKGLKWIFYHINI